MLTIPIPHNENERLARLYALNILNTAREERFDRLTFEAAQLFDASLAFLSLVGECTQWLKSRYNVAEPNLEAEETPRDTSFCTHAIMGKDTFVIPDTHRDSRFVSHPLVVGIPFIRFYAGHPLTTPEGYNLGTLCVVDHKPYHPDEKQLAALRELALLAKHELLTGKSGSPL